MSDGVGQDHTILHNAPEYECPKHGIVKHTITFDQIHAEVDGRYCSVCIGEFLKLLCCRVKEVPRAVASGKTA